MNLKKFLRGPLALIILAGVFVWIGVAIFTASGYREAPTQKGLDFITSGKTASATIIAGDNRVDLTLKDADPTFGKKVQFYCVTPRGDDVVKAVDDATLSGCFNV